jgi:hypothetical protein
MNWGLLSTVFLIATFKFMFAPFTGQALGLSFWETFLASSAGGILSATLFFFFSELIIKISDRRKLNVGENNIKKKKKFTRTNRAIIKVKRSLGIYGICFCAPFFLSVPIGSIVAAKLYGKLNRTFPLIVLGMFLNSFLMSTVAYLIFR